MSIEKLISKRGVAESLGVHPQTVMRLVRENKFPKPLHFHGARSTVRFRASDVEAWIEQRANAAA
jgi:excisionase family DNA binding protein